MFRSILSTPAKSDIGFTKDLLSSMSGADGGVKSLAKSLSDIPLTELSKYERSTLLKTMEFMVKDGHLSCAEANCFSQMVGEYTHACTPSFKYSLTELIGMAVGLTSSDGTIGSVMQHLKRNNDGCGIFLRQWWSQAFRWFFLQNMIKEVLGGVSDNAWSGALEGAFAQADLSSLSPKERTQLASMTFMAAADDVVNWPEANMILNKLNQFQANADNFPIPYPCECPVDQLWTVEQNGSNATIDLGDYTLTINEKRSEFILTNKETGNSSRVWGDPHFDMDNDGKTDVDFWGTMTMNLENGTKITIQTTPWKGNENMTVSSRLVITQGDKAIEVTGMDQNSVGDMEISQTNDGRFMDTVTGDGLDIYENDGKWMVRDGLQMREVTQEDMNTTKGNKSDFDVLESLELMNLFYGSIFTVLLTSMMSQAFEDKSWTASR